MNNIDSTTSSLVIGRVRLAKRGKKGIYVAHYYHAGQHQAKSLQTRHLRAARDAAIILEAQLATGTLAVAPKPVRIGDAITQFIESKASENCAPKTLGKYRTTLAEFQTFAKSKGIINLTQITPSLFERFRGHLQTSGNHEETINDKSVLVKTLLKWCERRDMIAKNPVAYCSIPFTRPAPKAAATLDQINAILAKAAGERRIQLALLAFGGMRSGELAMMEPKDVDMAGGWLRVPTLKRKRTRTIERRRVPIHPRLRDYLASLPTRPRPFLFCAGVSGRYPAGNHPMNTKHLLEYFQGLCRELHQPVGRKANGLVIHSLRHFFETHCRNHGVPQQAVDAWLGHYGDRSMGAIYYGASDADMQRLMAQVPF